MTKYHPVGNGCGPCPEGCVACVFTTGFGYTCSSCSENYYLDNNICKKCVSPCKKCNTLINCLSCIE